jgi:hypothetical protein
MRAYLSRRTFVAARLLLAGMTLGLAGSAAAAPLVYVARTGNDTNPCTDINAPCQHPQRGVDAADEGGTVVLLTPLTGGVAITKSVTIEGNGNTMIGQIVVVRAGGKVTFRRLVVTGHGALGTGIRVGDAAQVRVEDSVIERFTGNGIQWDVGGEASLVVERSTIRDLGGRGIAFGPTGSGQLLVANSVVTNVWDRGIYIFPGTGGGMDIKAAISRCEIHDVAGNGIYVSGEQAPAATIDVTVSDSIVSSNQTHGIRAFSYNGADVTVTIVRSASINNDTGVSTNGATTIMRIGQSTITGNHDGWVVLGTGKLYSYGDNYVDGNFAHQSAMPKIVLK